MAQHKAPTAVTFATTEESSGFKAFVDRYWKLGLLLALAGSAALIYASYSSQEAKKQLDASWETLHRFAQNSKGNPAVLEGTPSELIQGEASSLRGTQAGPWALWIAASEAADKGEWDEAKQALTALRQNYPSHPLVVDKQPVGAEGAMGSMVDELEKRYDQQKAWKASRADLFANPAPPTDAPKVRLKTDQGDIVVALYTNEAPKHVENFLKLCREGYYTNTKFHRVVKDFMIQGGDPNSRNDDRKTWGMGGPDYKIDREENKLHTFAGYLAAAKQSRDTQSSGSQFFITTTDKLTIDGQYVVFGKVLEGMDVAHKIEGGEIEADTVDRPKSPVVLVSTEVL